MRLFGVLTGAAFSVKILRVLVSVKLIFCGFCFSRNLMSPGKKFASIFWGFWHSGGWVLVGMITRSLCCALLL